MQRHWQTSQIILHELIDLTMIAPGRHVLEFLPERILIHVQRHPVAQPAQGIGTQAWRHGRSHAAHGLYLGRIAIYGQHILAQRLLVGITRTGLDAAVACNIDEPLVLCGRDQGTDGQVHRNPAGLVGLHVKSNGNGVEELLPSPLILISIAFVGRGLGPGRMRKTQFRNGGLESHGAVQAGGDTLRRERHLAHGKRRVHAQVALVLGQAGHQ